MGEDQTAERAFALLPTHRHGVKANIVRKYWSTLIGRVLKKQFVGELIYAVFLSGPDVHMTEPQLGHNGMIHAYVNVER